MLAGNIGAALPTGLGFSLGRAGAAAAAAAAANGCTNAAANGAANVSSANGAANGAAGGQSAPPPQQQRHRLVVFQGDGGLQMTAQELGTFARFGSDAIVILVNNDGYLVERYLSPIPHSSEGRLAARWVLPKPFWPDCLMVHCVQLTKPTTLPPSSDPPPRRHRPSHATTNTKATTT